MKDLEPLLLWLCENLPLNITLFEENSLCQKPSDKCKYCKKHGEETYFCHKKTYTGKLVLD